MSTPASQQPPTPPAVPAPPAVPLPGAQVPGMPAEQLLPLYQQLTEQLAGLQAQRRVLRQQISSGQADVAQTAGAQLVKVETDIAHVSVQLADVRARLSTRPGQPGTRPPFDPQNNGRRQGMDSGDVTGIAITFILAVLMPISIGITRKLLRKNPRDVPSPAIDALGPRLDRLEQSVEAIAIEIERIAEGQRFVTKVMAERPAQSPKKPPESSDTSAQALGEAKPFLALGAGPIEPIRVAERQAVRQSITPH